MRELKRIELKIAWTARGAAWKKGARIAPDALFFTQSRKDQAL